MYVFINIGTNLGNRRLNLSRAMRMVEEEFGYFEMSHVVETEPWGFVSANKFLNVGMMFATELSPEEVLARLQDMERRLSSDSHRNPDGSYADRIIDIDIVAIDDMVIDTPALAVPHPRLGQRDFFLVPLEELAPTWRHPVSGLTATQMLENLNQSKKEEKE